MACQWSIVSYSMNRWVRFNANVVENILLFHSYGYILLDVIANLWPKIFENVESKPYNH